MAEDLGSLLLVERQPMGVVVQLNGRSYVELLRVVFTLLCLLGFEELDVLFTLFHTDWADGPHVDCVLLGVVVYVLDGATDLIGSFRFHFALSANA